MVPKISNPESPFTSEGLILDEFESPIPGNGMVDSAGSWAGEYNEAVFRLSSQFD